MNEKRGGRKLGLWIIVLVLLIGTFIGGANSAYAKNAERTVRVAFFPMDGYNEYLADGSFSGMDVEYLNAVNTYTNWNIEYIKCDSWDQALTMLAQKQVDLVGSAQYSNERAESFEYADLPSGYTFGIIAVDGDSELAYEDFTAMKSITYGVVSTYVRKDNFLTYLENNGIKDPKIKEYESTEALREAFSKKEIDAYVHTFTEIQNGQRIVGRFAPKPFYYITYPGNDEVMSELNQAIVDLKINQPELENELLNQFYASKLDKTIVFTTDEKNYIKENPELSVGFMDGFYPISYVQDGEIQGLGKNVMQTFSTVSDMNLNYVVLLDQQSAVESLKNGKIDLLCYSNLTEELIEENDFKTTDAYVNIPMVIIAEKGNHASGIQKVAVVSDLMKEAQQVFYQEGIECIVCDSQQDCMKAVQKNQADVALCDGYLTEYLLGQDEAYGTLEVQSVVNMDHKITMAYRADAAKEFTGILDKTITTISDKEISEYVMQHNKIGIVSIRQFIQENSSSIILVLIILIMIFIMVGVHMLNDSRKIQKLMYKDFNMDVWNLNYLTYQAGQHLPTNGREHFAIVTINISQFRLYNTLYGWEVGQELLEKVVKMMSEYIEKSKEIYARDQGDRFVLFLKYENEEELISRLNMMKSNMEEQILKNTTNHMTIIMGAYLIPDDSKDLQRAISNANLAMDAANEHKTKKIFIYDEALEKTLKEDHKKEQLLNSVDFSKDFVAFYQAKVDIRSERIVGAEALVRFKDPTSDGMIRAPFYFVPYYEKTGKITEIDFCVLENVCRMLRRRIDEGKNVVTVSCNFSRHHFMKPGFPERFEAVLNKYNIPKDLIEVEITETLVVEELQQQAIKDTIDILQEKGIRLSIDDFGSGYSSLGVFEQIPAAVIKLDRSFLLNQEDRDRQVAIMRGIVHMAGDLKAQVVCEGVENDNDVELMKEIGAFIAQGYRFSKPIPEDEFESKLDSQIEA